MAFQPKIAMSLGPLSSATEEDDTHYQKLDSKLSAKNQSAQVTETKRYKQSKLEQFLGPIPSKPHPQRCGSLQD